MGLSDFFSFFSGKSTETPAVLPLAFDVFPGQHLPTKSEAETLQKSSGSTTPSSPGTIPEQTAVQFEQFAREYQLITQQENFDGFRLDAVKNATKQLQASHTLYLGTSLKETGYIYQFGPTYVRENGSLLLIGRYGIDGVVNGRFGASLLKGLEFKANMSSSLKEEARNNYDCSLDYTTKDWATSLKCAWQGAWILNGCFSQVITPGLHLGGELTWIPASCASIGAIGARYMKGNSIVTCNLIRQPDFKGAVGQTTNQHMAKVQYVRKVTDRFSLAAEYEFSPSDEHSAMRMGYEYYFRQARVQGLIDTCGRVSLLTEDSSGFGVSGVIDYWRGDYKFGFMMRVVPQPEAAPTNSPM